MKDAYGKVSIMFENIIPLIQQIANDRTVPRNIRTKCEDSIKILQNEKEDLAVRVNTVISIHGIYITLYPTIFFTL